MSPTITTPEIASETLKEPAKQWRNRFWLSARQRIGDGSISIGPGVGHWGPFASKAEGEARADRWLREVHSGRYIVEATIIYLGAFPVEGSE